MKKKNILKVCALGLCAVTVFAGGAIKDYRTQDKVLSSKSVEYKSSNTTDRKVVSVKIESKEMKDNIKLRINATNEDGGTIWQRDLGTIGYGTDATSLSDYQGSKYYYITHNGKLYALDIQTGKVAWSVNSNLEAAQFIEAGDKLVVRTGMGISHIAVYDIKTGKYLKSIKNIEEKYFADSVSLQDMHYINGKVVIDVINNYQPDEIFGYIKLDVNKYKMIFEEVKDKKVVKVEFEDERISKDYFNIYVNATNKAGQTIWKIDLGKIPYGIGLENWLSFQGKEYYYLSTNNEFRALDIQTGKVVWSVHEEMSAASVVEAGDKLFIREGMGEDNFVVFDIKTGKKLKKIEDIQDKYLLKDTSRGFEEYYDLDTSSMKYNNGEVTIDVRDRDDHGNDAGKVGYLKINTNTYKIEFIK